MRPTDPPAARAPRRALAALAAALALAACGQPSGALAPIAAGAAAGGSGDEPAAAPPPRALVLALSAAGAPPGSPPGGSVSLSAAAGPPLAAAGVRRAALSELQVPGGARLRLSATPAEGFAFMRWSGACAAEASPVCLLDVAAQPPGPARAGAEFGPLRRLSVEVVSDGPGLTAAAPPAAPRRLAAGRHRLEYRPGTAVALSPEAAPGARAQWSGDCAGTASTGTCALSMDRDRAAGVRFRPVRGLSLAAAGPGRLSHRVLSGALGPDGDPLAGGPAGGAPARGEVEAFRGAEVALRAEPDPGALFAGWDGDGACARRAEPDCRVRLGDAGAAAGARFGAAAPLAVALASDSGAVGLPVPDAPSVTPSAPWLAPAAARSASFDMPAPAGASATLTAAPSAFPESAAAEVAFVGWFGGQCAGPPTAARCEVVPAGGPPAGARFVPAGGALVEARFARLRSLSVRAASLGGAAAGGARVSGTRLAAVTGTVTLDWGEPPGAPRTVPPEPAGAAEFRALDEPGLRGLRLEAVPDGEGALFLGWVDRDAGAPHLACGAEPSCTAPMDRDRALDPWFARLAAMAVLLERLDPGTPESATASLTLSWSPAPPSPAAGFGPSPASFAVAPASPSDTFTTGVPADPAVRVSLEADPGAGGYVNAWGGLPAGASCAREQASCSFPAAASAGGALAAPTVSFGAYNRLAVANPGAGSGTVVVSDVVRGRDSRLELGPGGTAELGELLDGGRLDLMAEEAPGSRFRGWGGAAAGCAAAAECRLDADAPPSSNTVAVSARFGPLVRSTLTVTAQGVGVRVAVAGGESRDVAAGSSAELPVSEVDAATLSFAGQPGAGLSPRWRGCPEPGPGPAAEADCLVRNRFGSLTVTAVALALRELRVSAAAGGSADALAAGVSATVAAGSSAALEVTEDDGAALRAVPDAGQRLAGWTLSGGNGRLGCAATGDDPPNPCTLAAGSFTANASATASFEVRLSALTVSAGPGGSVAVTVAGVAAPVPVAAEGSAEVDFITGSVVSLAASPATGYRFVRWTLSDGLACRDGPQASPCIPAPAGADASARAEFSSLPNAVSWIGPGAVEESGLALTAVPYVEGAFEEWRGGDCDGSAEPTCMRPDSGYPVAVFRPFVAAGIKSLAFGLGYQGESPNSFQASLRRRAGAGYEAPQALEALPGPGQDFASLAAPVHLLPWGRGGYLTEACDASSNCEAALGGERALAQAVSRAVTGYFKAPGASADDEFGSALALSEDGGTLAVGAFDEDSSYTGTFAPQHPDYQRALASNGVVDEDNICSNNACDSGAVTVYRRSDDGWEVEAFVKAPVAGRNDHFGFSVALSADGATLAVGASLEDSASTGTFVPNDAPDSDYQLALDSNGASASGAVTVYRRSDAGTWAIEAFVKAPKAGSSDIFGEALALSADGDVMAVGAPNESGSSTGTFVPSEDEDSDYRRALDDNGAFRSGAVTVYRRRFDTDNNAWVWDVEAFVKAPATGVRDNFGRALALSADDATLAVGAPNEDSAHTGTFVPSDVPGSDYQLALASNDLASDHRAGSEGELQSGAVTVYRRRFDTGNNAWVWDVEAFVKAPVVDVKDFFGTALALSADGGTLAVGVPDEDSASTGTFVPSEDEDSGYRRALASNSLEFASAGAVIVYRRRFDQADNGWVWEVEAFVKAPKTVSADGGEGARFGVSLDLSSNGVVMAVGSSGESGSVSGVFVPEGTDYQGALDSDRVSHQDSGAAYVYRRRFDQADNAWVWDIQAFVKAPNRGQNDDFGTALALSADGDTLAVGAPFEDAAALPQPVSGGSAGAGNAVGDSGAVYLY